LTFPDLTSPKYPFLTYVFFQIRNITPIFFDFLCFKTIIFHQSQAEKDAARKD